MHGARLPDLAVCTWDPSAPGSTAGDGNDGHDRGPDWLDVTGSDISKATTLERLRTKLEVPIEHTVAISDGTNDIEALPWAGRGVATGPTAEGGCARSGRRDQRHDRRGRRRDGTGVSAPARQPTKRSA
ncbi:HAD family hydrolase [Promicromonospora sp. NFX87]|uniref:HAD family hydrolase n=1 Tax=Promicromonospora sp. NFX87 TaxID=3402691 RepID=UPI003AFA9F8B